MATQKKCSTCKNWKDNSEFYSSKFIADGLHNACKSCSKASAKKSLAVTRKQREEDGLCMTCGAPRDVENRRNCSACLDRAKKYQDGFYFKRISVGLCGYCGKRELKSKKMCSACLQRYHDEKTTHPQRRILRAIRRKAKDVGLDFNLELSDINIPDLCPLLEIPLKIGNGVKTDNSPSVDRINPKRGYVKGNVWIISDKANRMKNDGSPEEIFLLAKNIKKFISLF